MSPADQTSNDIGLLLAAGASRRFGAANKLLAPLNGRPLIGYAAEAMRGAGVSRRIVVISDPAVAVHLDGFEIVQIARGEQSDSLRAGLAAATGAERLLIALGDMPLVTSGLLRRVLEQASEDMPSASCDVGGQPMPPACFPRAMLPALARLTGDQGAGRLIRDLPTRQLVRAEGQLVDVDTAADLGSLTR